MSFLGINNKDVGIDLGTANLLMTVKGKGIVLSEPSVVSLNVKTNEVLAVGYEAKEMIGRTPDSIKAIRPLKDGVIADYNATQVMLKTIIKKICTRYNTGKPRVVVGVPSGITEVEERAVEEAIISAGAREVYLIEEPMAAAIGAEIDVAAPTGSMIVDIGGGTTEVAVISLGGIVLSNSIKIAGDELDADIIDYCKKNIGIIIGEGTAENIKTTIGIACLDESLQEEKMQISGRDVNTGLPIDIEISQKEVLEAMQSSIMEIVDVVKLTLEKTPPELASDIVENGIILSGGGALIKNIDKLLNEKTKIPVSICQNPLDSVVRGTEKTLEDIEKLKNVLISARKRK